MKLIHATALSLALIASPALAMRITNLDKVPQTVALTQGTNVDQRTIAPGDTEYYTGAPRGQLMLVPTPVYDKKGKASKRSAKHQSVVHADGMLSGIIGNESDTLVADPDNDYAIWPGGKLQVQSGRHNRGGIF